MTTKPTKAQQQEAITRLREWMPKGSTVYTVLRHVSASGMTRHISVVAILPEGCPIHPNHAVAMVLGYSLVNSHGSDALRVGGCGMDMGFHIAHALSCALYGDGCALRHQWL